MEKPAVPKRIEHVGIAVSDLNAAIGVYEKLLGTPPYAVEEVADQHVRTAFFRVGESKIELLESTSPDGPIAKFIAKRGEGIHHIAFALDDLRSALAGLAAGGSTLIDAAPRAGAEGLSIAFIHPGSACGVLTELTEDPRTAHG
ncbi:MAG TPA: methylmalonyl-CoA epimerase [Bacteroidota bacterium]|nr:methylmalonyl-CoA epimerase [Bacteroidota bacterium]